MTRARSLTLFWLVPVAMVLWLYGCATYTPAELPPPPPPPPAAPPIPPVSLPAPTPTPKHVTASWYGPGLDGHVTSTGETYNQNSMTAASKTLPIGSHVIVTNPKNGRSVEVRINDRGPHVRGRSLDLSKKAASKLGITDKGVSRVEITPAPPKHHAQEARAEEAHEHVPLSQPSPSAVASPASVPSPAVSDSHI